MRSVLLHIIVVLTALNVVTLNQFTKTPLLVVHFLDHLHRDHKMNICDFMQMHYFGDDINDNDHQQDKQLPLKDFNLNYTFEVTLPPDFLKFTAEQINFNSKSSFPLFGMIQFRSSFISRLYRPPQLLA